MAEAFSYDLCENGLHDRPASSTILDRARDFLKGMDLLKDDLSQFKSSSALLGNHGAISYCDALRIGLGSDNVSSDDHQKASGEPRKLLAARRYERLQGVDRLERLLARKNWVAYSPDSAEEKDIKSIIQQAERFAVSAETAGKALIERW